MNFEQVFIHTNHRERILGSETVNSYGLFEGKLEKNEVKILPFFYYLKKYSERKKIENTSGNVAISTKYGSKKEFESSKIEIKPVSIKCFHNIPCTAW